MIDRQGKNAVVLPVSFKNNGNIHLKTWGHRCPEVKRLFLFLTIRSQEKK